MKVEVFDPYDQTDLHPLIQCEPAGNQLDIVNSYHVDGDRIFCHICGGHRHRKGYTGLTDNHTAFLFGSKCAKSYFPEEVLKAAERIFKNKLAAVDAEYNVQVIKSTAREMERWLKTNSNMIDRMDHSWCMLFDQNPDFIEEVFEHLDRHENRLTQEYVSEASDISKAVGRNERTTTVQIVAAIGNENGRKQVKYLKDNTRLITQFTHLLLNLQTNSSSEHIKLIDKKLRSNFFNAVDNLDLAMKFSVEFFSLRTLTTVGKWSDAERNIRLKNAEIITPRNMPKLLIDKIGSGYQMPSKSLRDVISTEHFLLDVLEGEEKITPSPAISST